MGFNKKNVGYEHMLMMTRNRLIHIQTMMHVSQSQGDGKALGRFTDEAMQYEDIIAYIEQKMDSNS